MYQFGRLKNLCKHKIKNKHQETLTITEDYAIINAANSLMLAEELAKVTGDKELLIAISDRWLNLSAFVASEEHQVQPFGFIPVKEEDNVGEDYSEGHDQSKGRIKIRKKSR